MSTETLEAGTDPSGGSASLPLRVRFRLWRNSVISSARFRRNAERVPGVATVSRSRARELFDLTAGFAYTQALHALVQAGLPQCLNGHALTFEQIQGRCAVRSEGALRRLLDAGVGIGIVWRGNDHYALTDTGVALVSEPGVVAMIEHHALTYEDLKDPLPLLERTAPPARTAEFWQYSGGRAESGTTPSGAFRYSELMRVTQGFVIEQLLDAFPFARSRHVVDIGGGSGNFIAAALRRFPDLEGTVFDLPDVASAARERLAREGLTDRASAVAGSFHDGQLPGDADVYTLIRVLYDHDDEPAEQLLASLRASMPAGARLVIAEPMSEASGAGRVGAYFTMYLAAMQSGQCRSATRIAGMLTSAGFTDVRLLRVRNPMHAGIVTARR